MSLNEWLSYLTAQGLDMDERRTLRTPAPETGNDQLTASNTMSDLSPLALIRAEGRDCNDFLQGQLTNDIQQVTDEQGQLSAYCSPKGRMFTDLRIFRHQDALHLFMPHALAATVIKRLRMFVLRADVQLSDEDEQFARLGLAGPESANRLAAHGFKIPETINGTSRNGNACLMRIEGEPARFILVIPLGDARQWWQKLASDFSIISSSQWQLLNIINGLPSIEANSSEQFVPQMIGWDKLNGINLKKGCYVGQEIIARSHYLGKQKKGLRYGEVKNVSSPPQVGARLQAAGQGESQSAGQIINAAEYENGCWRLLASVDIETSQQSRIHLESANGPEIHWLDTAPHSTS